jgi:hypothetical protein
MCGGAEAGRGDGIRVGAVGEDLQTGRATVAAGGASRGCSAFMAAFGGSVGAEGDDGDGSAVVVVAAAVGGKGAAGQGGRADVADRGRVQREGRAVGGRVVRGGAVRGKGRVARDGGPRRRVDRGQLALAVAGGRGALGGEAVGRGRVLEGD